MAIIVILFCLFTEAARAGTMEVEYVAEASEQEMYEMSQDGFVTPECRAYADLALTGKVLIDAGYDFPDLLGPQLLFKQVYEALPTVRFDCEVSV